MQTNSRLAKSVYYQNIGGVCTVEKAHPDLRLIGKGRSACAFRLPCREKPTVFPQSGNIGVFFAKLQ
ncbi:hypothetical protein CR205_04030 [Alteribacter lacisalsi]|uniref:Uncharacterized protein n=1 Tax=Alteribacter lacisalsi TaxID=2045244 RepID=A0A2W0HA37_9BACI|nr:hypothetical protein CR205_04030 [Alteribacter lacisalsi]